MWFFQRARDLIQPVDIFPFLKDTGKMAIHSPAKSVMASQVFQNQNILGTFLVSFSQLKVASPISLRFIFNRCFAV